MCHYMNLHKKCMMCDKIQDSCMSHEFIGIITYKFSEYLVTTFVLQLVFQYACYRDILNG